MKRTAAILAIIALTSAPVFAAQTGGFVDPNAKHTVSETATTTTTAGGGFIGPSGDKSTVKEAKTYSDDTWVTLTGKIEKRIGGNDYVFRDSTDSVNVEISDKRWNGQTITPQDTVEIQGKVDKDWNSVEIDVKKITKQ